MHVWTREHTYKNYIKLIQEYKQKDTCWVIAMVIETSTRSMLEVGEWTRWSWNNAKIQLYSISRVTSSWRQMITETNSQLPDLSLSPLSLPICRLLMPGIFGFGYNRTAWKKFTKDTWKIKSEINCLFISNKNKYSRIKQVNFLLKLKLIGY